MEEKYMCWETPLKILSSADCWRALLKPADKPHFLLTQLKSAFNEQLKSSHSPWTQAPITDNQENKDQNSLILG